MFIILALFYGLSLTAWYLNLPIGPSRFVLLLITAIMFLWLAIDEAWSKNNV